jgi:alpha-galactosidase
MQLSPALRTDELDGRPAWLINLRRTAMLLCLGPNDALLLPYWGPGGQTTRAADYLMHPQGNRASQREFLDGRPLAYPVFGDATFKEVCLVVTRADGSRECRPTFVEARTPEVDGHPALDLVFADTAIGLHLTHRFHLFTDQDVVSRSVTIENQGSETVGLERALSAALPLPPGAYDALTLNGQWGRECELHQRPLGAGKLIVESRRGLSSHEAHPWFAVRPRGDESENRGAVWFGSLAWSGNWLISLEVEANDALHIVAGLQPFDFAWRLAPGEKFTTPQLVSGYSDGGLGGASRLLHAFENSYWLPENHRDQQRPVLYNSWEATNFAVSAGHQIELARKAAGLGVELFVVDDGWFGARDHDRAGLGDWSVNATKFPRGLGELVDEVHRLGMQFGIWVEPEMVNPDSDLYRAHPDWAYHVGGRTPTYGRNQLVLNFAREDVRAYITEQLRRLLTDHGTMKFVKWDHNRAWTEVGWPERPAQQREVWVRHVLGLYEVLATLRREFPHVLFESCAGGGGRADLGILRYTDQVWTSDNTDAVDRLQIQYGYSRAHSPRVMVNWVTDVPNQQTGRSEPLAFRFHVAMQGVLGIGGHIGEWSEADLNDARRMIAEYKQLRALVQFGQQYWLAPPRPVGPMAVQYVAPDGEQTVVFVYQVRGRLGAGVQRVRLHGLAPERRYRREIDGAESAGAALMSAGIPADVVDPRHARAALDWRSGYQVWRAL